MRKPVGLTAPYRADDDDDIQVYKKPWVGLTDEEKRQILLDDPIDWINAIEAKLKEKNA